MLWNIIIIKKYIYLNALNAIDSCDDKSTFSAAITPGFSVT